MKRFIFFLLYLVALVMIVALDIGLVYVVPYPYNKTNLLMAFLVIMLMVSESGKVVWLSFILHFFIELYALTPFGVVLFSGTSSMLVLFWMYKSIVTNRTFVAATLLSSLAIVLYRLSYSVLLVVSNLFASTGAVAWHPLFVIYGWELLFTVSFTSLLYIIVSRLTRYFNLTVVSKLTYGRN